MTLFATNVEVLFGNSRLRGEIDFYRILRELLEGEDCGIILSTHIEEIEKQLDYVGILEEGRLVFWGKMCQSRKKRCVYFC